MTITFVIMVEKICFHVLFRISLYQSPRVQVVLQSPLHFDSIISFSTKKPLSYQIQNSFWPWKSSISSKTAIQYPCWSHCSYFKIYGSKNVSSLCKYIPKKSTEKKTKQKSIESNKEHTKFISDCTIRNKIYVSCDSQHNYWSWWTLGSVFSKTIQSDQ